MIVDLPLFIHLYIQQFSCQVFVKKKTDKMGLCGHEGEEKTMHFCNKCKNAFKVANYNCIIKGIV